MPYSQNLEETYILNYFGSFVGTFCDIGANNGVTFSNTRALALKNWKGILIEPSPKAFARLKELYKDYKDILPYNWAISTRNGKAMLQESGPLCSAADIGLVSTFYANEQDRFKRTVSYEPVEVKTYTWRTALNRWKFKTFDFISIDCEGADLEILKQIDLTGTRCLVVEWNSKPELKNQYLEYTSKYGMDKVIYESAENLIITKHFDKIMEGFKVIYTSGENLIYGL